MGTIHHSVKQKKENTNRLKTISTNQKHTGGCPEDIKKGYFFAANKCCHTCRDCTNAC